jgi:hypothetical protein
MKQNQILSRNGAVAKKELVEEERRKQKEA